MLKWISGRNRPVKIEFREWRCISSQLFRVGLKALAGDFPFELARSLRACIHVYRVRNSAFARTSSSNLPKCVRKSCEKCSTLQRFLEKRNKKRFLMTSELIIFLFLILVAILVAIAHEFARVVSSLFYFSSYKTFL